MTTIKRLTRFATHIEFEKQVLICGKENKKNESGTFTIEQILFCTVIIHGQSL